MAASSDRTVLYGAVGGALLGLIAGGGAAAVVALSSWPAPSDSGWSSVQLAVSGLCVGSVMGLAIGGMLGFHGSILGASTANRSETAPLWGLIGGVLGGASLGPVLAGVMGMAVDRLLDSDAYFAQAALFGVLAGPVLGVIGWQGAYWIADFLRAARSAHD